MVYTGKYIKLIFLSPGLDYFEPLSFIESVENGSNVCRNELLGLSVVLPNQGIVLQGSQVHSHSMTTTFNKSRIKVHWLVSRANTHAVWTYLNVCDDLINVELSVLVVSQPVHETDACALYDLDHVEVRHDQAPVVGALGLAGVL